MGISLDTIGSLRADIGVPTYRRGALKAGIVHFGVGNFHRAHQAAYLDRLFNTGRDLDWAILGAGVTDYDARMRGMLAGQDYFSTLVEQGADQSTARVTGAMIGYLDPADRAAIVAKLADPEIRIVSLTITEGGYYIDAATGQFDVNHPAIQADGTVPDDPKTVFGIIAAGLKARRDAGVPPFTVMSCDNIPHNGTVARAAVVGVARLSDPAFADWIAAKTAFPNGMVDRITPATGPREIDLLTRDFGISDLSPVFCEDFTQWVLEDNFPLGRPALETVGVQFVPDVSPYETMKIRILNGGHAVIAYPAGLIGIEFAHDAMGNDLIRDFLDKVERDEIIPVVPPVPDTDLNAYFELIKRRFANPKIGDTIRRLCLDGSNRQPKFIIPSIADRLKSGADVSGLALESALWCRYCFGETDAGVRIEPNDPNWDRLTGVAQAARHDPAAWLAMEDIYGGLGNDHRLADAFAGWLSALWSDGTETVLKRYLAGAAGS